MEAHGLRSSCFDVTALDAEARLAIPLTRAPSLDSDHLHQKIWPAYMLWVLGRSSPRPLTASCEHRWSVRFLVTFCPLFWIKMVLKHMKCLSEVKHFFENKCHLVVSFKVRRLRKQGLCWYGIPCSSWVFMFLVSNFICERLHKHDYICPRPLFPSSPHLKPNKEQRFEW
jgi:hypothetical protein